MSLCRDIDKLDPKVADLAKKALAEMDNKGIRYFVNETFRSKEVQIAYFAQGRKSLLEVNALRKGAGLWLISEDENKNTITKCDGVNTPSIHQSGKAIDICPTNGLGPWWNAPSDRWKVIADVMKSHGFEWGGDWSGSWDKPHYQVVS